MWDGFVELVARGCWYAGGWYDEGWYDEFWDVREGMWVGVGKSGGRDLGIGGVGKRGERILWVLCICDESWGGWWRGFWVWVVMFLLRGLWATKVCGGGGLVVLDENLFGPVGWSVMFAEDVVYDLSFMLVVVVQVGGFVLVVVLVLSVGAVWVILGDVLSVYAWEVCVTVAVFVSVASLAGAASADAAVPTSAPVGMSAMMGARSVPVVNGIDEAASADAAVPTSASLGVSAMMGARSDAAIPTSAFAGVPATMGARSVPVVDGIDQAASADAAVPTSASVGVSAMMGARSVPVVDGIDENFLILGVLWGCDAASEEEVVVVFCVVLESGGYTKGVGLLLLGVCLVLCGRGGNVFDGSDGVLCSVCCQWEEGEGEEIKLGWWRGNKFW